MKNGKMQTAAFIDENFLIDYLAPEEYFEVVAQLRKVDTQTLQDFLGRFEEFFNGEVLQPKKVHPRLLERKPKKEWFSRGIYWATRAHYS